MNRREEETGQRGSRRPFLQGLVAPPEMRRDPWENFEQGEKHEFIHVADCSGHSRAINAGHKSGAQSL